MQTFSPPATIETFNGLHGSLGGGSSRAIVDTLGVIRSSPGKFSIHNAVGPNNAFFGKNPNNVLSKELENSYNFEGNSSHIN